MSDEYVAGLFDGEGYIGLVRFRLQHRKNPSFAFCLRVVISNIHLGVLKRIQNKFGGGIEKATFSGRPLWNWRRQGKGAIPFLEAIQPYSVIKKPQIDLALEYEEKYKNDGAGKVWQPIEKRQKIIADKTIYIDKFKQLKRNYVTTENL